MTIHLELVGGSRADGTEWRLPDAQEAPAVLIVPASVVEIEQGVQVVAVQVPALRFRRRDGQRADGVFRYDFDCEMP